MEFACFDFFYFSLRDQLQRAKLKVWNNKWWMVYDFNKNEEKPNWSLMEQEEVPKLLRLECTSISPDELAMDCVIPVSLGSRAWPHEETCFILFLPQLDDALLEEYLNKVSKTDGWHLCRARSTLITEERARALFAWTKEPLVTRCKDKEVAGVQLCGENIHAEVEASLSGTMRLIPKSEVGALSKTFFETWKDEV